MKNKNDMIGGFKNKTIKKEVENPLNIIKLNMGDITKLLEKVYKDHGFTIKGISYEIEIIPEYQENPYKIIGASGKFVGVELVVEKDY